MTVPSDIRDGGFPDALIRRVDYDPETGEFRWKNSPRAGRDGTIAGRRLKDGYRSITLKGVAYSAHRLAWFLVKGTVAPDQIDHINGDTGDNRISNLREATPSQNCCNKPRADRDLPKGVTFHRQLGRYQAQVCVGGRSKYLGVFDTPEMAAGAYRAAAGELHGEFARFE